MDGFPKNIHFSWIKRKLLFRHPRKTEILPQNWVKISYSCSKEGFLCFEFEGKIWTKKVLKVKKDWSSFLVRGRVTFKQSRSMLEEIRWTQNLKTPIHKQINAHNHILAKLLGDIVKCNKSPLSKITIKEEQDEIVLDLSYYLLAKFCCATVHLHRLNHLSMLSILAVARL